MQILKSVLDFDKNLCPAVAVGTFDGIHSGHKKVLESTVLSGNFPVALVINRKKDENSPPAITTKNRRDELMESLGIKCILDIDLEDIYFLSPVEFVEDFLKKGLGAVSVSCGFNFKYGKNAAGDTALLKKLCEQKGIELCVAPPENYEGAPISSTRIRAAVEEGKMHDAAKMLSRYFSFDFPVLQGDKIGRTLDMPTINQAFPKGFILPKVGVYAVNVNIEGKNYKGVCNIGPRPTIDRTEFRAETNIIGFSGDLYGKRPRISLVEYIRETKKFPSLLALREEVARNIDYTEKLQFEGDLIG